MAVHMRSDNLLGIIGGAGPEATIYFTQLLLKYRGPVDRDQNHLPYLVFNNTQIPNSVHHLLHGAESPVAEFTRTGLVLKNAGATFLVIPCNTAHAFADELEKRIGLPIINLIDETVKYITKTYGDAITVGLLATTGTIQTKIYHKSFQTFAPKTKVLVPDENRQRKVMKACFDIKKFSADKNSFQLLNSAAHDLIVKGAQVIILGCTEIPLALTEEKCDFIRIDPMEIVAKKVISLMYMKKNDYFQENV